MVRRQFGWLTVTLLFCSMMANAAMAHRVVASQEGGRTHSAAYTFQHLGVIREAAEALDDLFEGRLDVTSAGKQTVIAVKYVKADDAAGHAKAIEALEEFKRVVSAIDSADLNRGYWIAHHLVRLAFINARVVEREFQATSEGFHLTAISDTILLILPLPGQLSETLEYRIAALKADLVEIDAAYKKSREGQEAKPRKTAMANPAAVEPHELHWVRLKHLKAKDVSRVLRWSVPGIGLSAITEEDLVITGEDTTASTPAQMAAGLQGLDEAIKKQDNAEASAKQGPKEVIHNDESRVVRLFHLRNATEVAAAINGAAPGDEVLVKPIGDDVLLIQDAAVNRSGGVAELKRYIAVLDRPRPQITLQVWTTQFSSRDAAEVEAASRCQHDLVDLYDRTLFRSLESAWREVAQNVRDQQKLFTDQRQYPHPRDQIFSKMVLNKEGKSEPVFSTARLFGGYLTEEYRECARDDRYCLGYTDAFAKGMPSLTRLLFFLAAAEDPIALVDKMIGSMGKAAREESLNVPLSCTQDWRLPTRNGAACGKATSTKSIAFSRLDGQLRKLFNDENRDLFRAAILDFLFAYKWTIQYPHDFVPYDFQRSAQVLDAMLAPVMDALHEDLLRLLESLQDQLGEYLPAKSQLRWFDALRKKEPQWQSAALGLIKVTTVSGQPAKVVGSTVNYFDITQPQTIKEMLEKNESLKTGLPDVLTEKEAVLAGIAANVLSQQRTIAEVGRGMTLSVTPVALESASSAELKIEFKVSEDAPSTIAGDSNQKATIDRIAAHEVSDTVRVEAMKLFEISTFAMLLKKRELGAPYPVVGWVWQPLFHSVPGLSRMFRWPHGLVERTHRSSAIIAAVIVPTSSDLALSLRIESDRELDASGTSRFHRAGDLPPQVRAFHKKVIRCLTSPLEHECKYFTLSDLLPDARD